MMRARMQHRLHAWDDYTLVEAHVSCATKGDITSHYAIDVGNLDDPAACVEVQGKAELAKGTPSYFA